MYRFSRQRAQYSLRYLLLLDSLSPLFFLRVCSACFRKPVSDGAVRQYAISKQQICQFSLDCRAGL